MTLSIFLSGHQVELNVFLTHQKNDYLQELSTNGKEAKKQQVENLHYHLGKNLLVSRQQVYVLDDHDLREMGGSWVHVAHVTHVEDDLGDSDEQQNLVHELKMEELMEEVEEEVGEHLQIA